MENMQLHMEYSTKQNGYSFYVPENIHSIDIKIFLHALNMNDNPVKQSGS